MHWKKSSYSGGQGGNCVETAADSSHVHIRDTTDRDGVTLRLGNAAWTRFTTSLKHDPGKFPEPRRRHR